MHLLLHVIPRYGLCTVWGRRGLILWGGRVRWMGGGRSPRINLFIGSNHTRHAAPPGREVLLLRPGFLEQLFGRFSVAFARYYEMRYHDPWLVFFTQWERRFRHLGSRNSWCSVWNSRGVFVLSSMVSGSISTLKLFLEWEIDATFSERVVNKLMRTNFMNSSWLFLKNYISALKKISLKSKFMTEERRKYSNKTNLQN